MLVSEMTFLRDHWYPVAAIDGCADTAEPASLDVAGPRITADRPLAVRLLGEDYVLFATGDGGYALTEPFCPHRSAHLSGGWVDGGELVCPYHGWRFDGGGGCTHIPQLDEHLPTPPRAALRTFPAVARYGVVWVCVGTPVTADPPTWVEAEEGGWRLYVEFFEQWQVSAPRIVDNNLDSSHVAYVHRSTFGSPDDALLPPIELERTERGFVSWLPQEQKGIGTQMGVTDDETRRFQRVGETELLAPLTSRTRIRFGGDGPDYCFFGTATPVDDGHSIYMRLSALSGSPDVQPWSRFHEFGTRVKEEDRIILESTVADFPVDITSEVHLRCDKVTLEYRKHLARLVSGTAEVAA